MNNKIISIDDFKKMLEENHLELLKKGYFYNITFEKDEVKLQGHQATNVFSTEIIFEHFKITDHGFIRFELESNKFVKVVLLFEI